MEHPFDVERTRVEQVVVCLHYAHILRRYTSTKQCSGNGVQSSVAECSGTGRTEVLRAERALHFERERLDDEAGADADHIGEEVRLRAHEQCDVREHLLRERTHRRVRVARLFDRALQLLRRHWTARVMQYNRDIASQTINAHTSEQKIFKLYASKPRIEHTMRYCAQVKSNNRAIEIKPFNLQQRVEVHTNDIEIDKH